MMRQSCVAACRTAIGAAVFLAPVFAHAGAADSYLQDARSREKANDFRGAIIQLRNAAQAEAANGAIHLELARVYLKVGNPNAAQAELFGQYGELLKNVPAGSRPARIESVVRTYRGMAAAALKETQNARAMFTDAERLDQNSSLPLIGEARLLMTEHQYEAAQRKADAALNIEPHNPDAMDAKAMVIALRGNFDAAIHQLNAALAIDPKNTRLLLDRANLKLQRNNFDEAAKDVARVLELQPSNGMALFLEASIDAEKGKFKEADAIIEKMRGALHYFHPAYLLAAQVKLKLNQVSQAEEFLQKYISQGGDQPRAYELLGFIALKRGDSGKAIEMLETALKMAPGDAEAAGLLGQAYVAHGDLDKAKMVFNQAALGAPGNTAIALQRAVTDFSSGDREAGFGELRNVFRNGKGNLAAGPPLVLEAIQMGRLDDAAAAAQELVTRDPGAAIYQELLALVRMRQGNNAVAEVLLRNLLSRNPNLESARRHLAQIYLRTNRVGEAKKLYQDRLRANPSDIESILALTDISFRQKDDAGAMKLLGDAQARLPKDPRPSLKILSILESRKKWREAVSRAKALQAKFPNEPLAQDALAHLYLASGNRAASVAAYQIATAKFPDNAILFTHYAGALAAGKDYAKAANAALRAVQLEPRSPDLKRAFVTLTYLAKGVEAALSAGKQAFGKEDLAALVVAEVLEANNNRPAAIALLERTQSQSPSGNGAVELASLYARAQQTGKALTTLQAWATAHPADIDGRYALARLYSVMGKYDQATAQYEWVASKRPEDPVILNNLAWLYDNKRDPRARGVAERALRLAPASASIADTLGWILVKQGDSAGSVKYLQQASVNMPDNGTIQYHYAVALSKKGDADQARAVVQRVLVSKASADTLAGARALLQTLKAAH